MKVLPSPTFIHEGNGALWDLALETGPAPHAGWMLVEEEQSEGGDVLAQRVRRDVVIHTGMTSRRCIDSYNLTVMNVFHMASSNQHRPRWR